MFHKKGLSDIDLKDKRVLLRADYNVPMHEGEIEDDYRITQSVPTIQALLEQHCRVVIVSHLGRPKGKVVDELSLRPVVERLSELLEHEVQFAEDVVGEKAHAAVHSMRPGDVLLLENIRFESGEVADDEAFAERLASFGDVLVQDAFGVVHRAHASTHAVTERLPSVAGLLLENEVRQITRAIEHPKKPMVAIIGGAKIHTKIQLLDNLIPRVDRLLIGGAMSNTFLVALGYEIGLSLHDEDEVSVAKEIIAQCKREHTHLVLPRHDVAVAKSVSPRARRKNIPTDEVGPKDYILDIGDKTTDAMIENLRDAGTVIWNGPVGMFELKAFAEGSNRLAEFIAKEKIDCVIGGGDTVELIDELDLRDAFTHVSTGGGSALELMSGLPLPGVEALLDKKEHKR